MICTACIDFADRAGAEPRRDQAGKLFCRHAVSPGAATIRAGPRPPVAGAHRRAARCCDLLVQPGETVQQRLRARRASWHIHIYRDQLIRALGDAVRIPVWSPAVGAGTVRDHIARLGQPLVGAQHHWCHLVSHRTRHHQDIGPPRLMRDRLDAEPFEVALAHRCRHEFDGAAGQPEIEHPQRVLAAEGELVPHGFKRARGARHIQAMHRSSVDSHAPGCVPVDLWPAGGAQDPRKGATAQPTAIGVRLVTREATSRTAVPQTDLRHALHVRRRFVKMAKIIPRR